MLHSGSDANMSMLLEGKISKKVASWENSGSTLRGVTFGVEEGELVAVFGASGKGKSLSFTFLRVRLSKRRH